MPCAICHTRKEKRYCPAVHDKICAICCGTEREVRFDCPSDCVYLQEARRRDLPRALDTLDPEPLFPKVEVRQQLVYEREPLIAGLSFALSRAARNDRGLHDRDLLSALQVMARRTETLVNSGLHYAEPVTSPPVQAVIAELEKMLKQYRDSEQKHMGYSTLKDSELLQVLVFMLRTGYARTSGRPRSRAFIDFLLQQFPEKEIAAAPSGSSLIIP
ncbi:MAG: hypothetical protein L0Z53_14620 [Acidobacteriales bacterium]|nr:hypothetical protein [Terriglobales bacterium]